MNSTHTHNRLLLGTCAGLMGVAACATGATVPWAIPTTAEQAKAASPPIPAPPGVERNDSPTSNAAAVALSGSAAASLSANESKPLPRPKQGAGATNGAVAPNADTDTKGGRVSAASWSDLLSVALPLALVVGLVLVCAAVLKRVAGRSGGLVGAMTGCGAPSGIVEVLGRYPVSRAQALVLLRVNRRVLLVSHAAGGGRSGPGGFTTLSQFDDAEDVAAILSRVNEAGTGAGRAKTANARFHAALRLFEKHGTSGEDDHGAAGLAGAPAGRRVVHGEQVRSGTSSESGPTDRVSLWDEHVARLPAAVSTAGDSDDLTAGVRARLAALRGRGAVGTMMGGGA